MLHPIEHCATVQQLMNPGILVCDNVGQRSPQIFWNPIICSCFPLQAIDGLYRDGVKKPLQLFNILRSRHIIVDSKKQIDNYLARHREKIHGPSAVTYNDISEWCERKSALPDDQHQVTSCII